MTPSAFLRLDRSMPDAYDDPERVRKGVAKRFTLDHTIPKSQFASCTEYATGKLAHQDAHQLHPPQLARQGEAAREGGDVDALAEIRKSSCFCGASTGRRYGRSTGGHSGDGLR